MPFNPAQRRRAEELVARYPHSKSALLPLLHLAQDGDGYVTRDAMEEIGGDPEAVDVGGALPGGVRREQSHRRDLRGVGLRRSDRALFAGEQR